MDRTQKFPKLFPTTKGKHRKANLSKIPLGKKTTPPRKTRKK